jgi:hypothetical protein
MSVARGVIGMGVTFAAVAGAFFSVLAVVVTVFFSGVEDEPGFMIIAGSVWGFAIGVAFAGVLAIAGRGRGFDELSIPRVAALGAGGGLLLAGLLVGVTWQEWSVGDATVPLVILPLLGAGSATASLLLARRAAPVLASGESSQEDDDCTAETNDVLIAGGGDRGLQR